MYGLLVRKQGEAKKANKDTSVEGLKGIFNVLIAFTLKAMALDEPGPRYVCRGAILLRSRLVLARCNLDSLFRQYGI
jgi:hypothetical protein